MNRILKSNIFGLFMLTACSSWNEDFEGKVVRAYPDASIHKINQMTDEGTIVEEDRDESSKKREVFEDREVVRGAEDVRRLYIMTYEDMTKNLHMSHHIYFVAKPAGWVMNK